MSFFALKISDPGSSQLVDDIKAGSQSLVIQQLNQLESDLIIGSKVFIQLGGDKVDWEKGLIGLAEITKPPYEKGYDEKSPRNFKLGLKMLLVLKSVIKREEFRFYVNTYDAGGIGPNTRGEQNQAIKALTDTQACSIIRAIAEREPNLKENIKDLFNTEFCDCVFGKLPCMIEKEMSYDESLAIRSGSTISENTESVDVEKSSVYGNCLQIQRNPRTNKLHPLNFIIYGAPGTGKTYSTVEYALAIIENKPVDLSNKTTEQRKAEIVKYKKYIRNKQIVFTTFHQNYGYEEFIQGLRPDTESENMAFKIVDGIFKKIADLALNDEDDRNYVIIIDEINRANISKVFGELITLIEEDKRWGELNESCAMLQSGDVFAVPNNLYIVGTMNSADKSISLIDAALRRRFEFIEQRPDISLVKDIVLRNMLENLNLCLVNELDSTDLLIGHSYFMNKSESDLCEILNNSIIPLLYEYFYDNRKKVANVLEESIDKSNAGVEIVYEKIGRLRVKDNR